MHAKVSLLHYNLEKDLECSNNEENVAVIDIVMQHIPTSPLRLIIYICFINER